MTRTLGESFRRIDATQVRVLLVDAGHEPLHAFGDRLSEIAAHELEELGVELHMGVKVTAVDAEGLVLTGPSGSERIQARTVVWAAGVQASPLAAPAGRRLGRDVRSRGPHRGRPRLHAPQSPRVFAIGDMASLERLPGVAEVAMQQGLYAAKTIRRRVAAGMTCRRSSTATSEAWRPSGASGPSRASRPPSARLPGWLLWGTVHMTFLTGFANRFSALFHWMRTLLSRRRSELAYSSRFTRPSHPR